MFGSDLLYTALNVASITNLLDTQDSVVGLFSGRLIPEFFTENKTINFYSNAPFDGSLEYQKYVYSINCRAKTDAESRTIAQAVFDIVNRADFTDYHTNCSVLGTLPPQDNTDVFNTPLEVIIKTRL